MAEVRIRSSFRNFPDGSSLWFPPDSVFVPVAMNPDINLELTGTAQLFSIGSRYEDAWGRVFRYVEYGGTIAQNSLVQAEAPDAVHDDLDLSVAAVVGDTALVVASPASGSADFIADEYAQGWVYSESLVSALPMLIRTHLLWDISDSIALTVELWHPVRTAIAVDCDLSFIKSKYKEVIIQPHSTPTGALVGVNAGDGAVDGRLGWVQVKGVCKVLGDTVAGALLVGEMVTVSTTVDGAVDSYNEDGTENLVIVGRILNFLDGTEWQLVDLCVE